MAFHYILGWTRCLADDLKATAEVYHKQFDDLIVQSDRTIARRTNQGDGSATGFDLSVVKKFSK